jgi:hypothetical protein
VRERPRRPGAAHRAHMRRWRMGSCASRAHERRADERAALMSAHGAHAQRKRASACGPRAGRRACGAQGRRRMLPLERCCVRADHRERRAVRWLERAPEEGRRAPGVSQPRSQQAAAMRRIRSGAQLGARSGAPRAPRVSRSGAPPATWLATVRWARRWCAARSSLGSAAGERCGSRRRGGPPGHRGGGRAARRGRGGGRLLGGGAPAAREDPEVEILELIADGASQAEEVRPAALDAELLEGAGREVAVCGGLASVEQDGHEHLESRTLPGVPGAEVGQAASTGAEGKP